MVTLIMAPNNCRDQQATINVEKERRRRKSSSNSIKDLRDTHSDVQLKVDTTRDDDYADISDYNGTQQRDQQPPRSRRKSPSPQPTDENSSSDEEDEEVGEVRAEDNGHRARRKKSSLNATPSETVLPKSANMRNGANT